MKITSCSSVSEKSVGYYELLWTHTLFFFPDSDHCSGLKLLPRAGHKSLTLDSSTFREDEQTPVSKWVLPYTLEGGQLKNLTDPDVSRSLCYKVSRQNTLCRGLWAVVYAGAHPRGTHPHTAGQYTSTALGGSDWAWSPSLLLPACMFQTIKISFIRTSKCKH